MSGERLVASYIVQLTIKGGERAIKVLDIEKGSMRTLTTYSELIVHLQECEERKLPDKSASSALRRKE